MTVRTEQDLIEHVLRHALAVTPAFGDIAPADAATVRSIHAAVHEYLHDESIAYWPASEIPGAVFLEVARVVAAECGPAFGLPKDEAGKAMGVAQMRRHVAKRASDHPTEIHSF